MIRVAIPVGLALLTAISGCSTADRAGSGHTAEAGEIAFVSNRDGDREIDVLEFATGRVTRLTNHEARDGSPAWSPDGSPIAFYGNVGPGFVGADIFTIAPDGTGLVNLTNDDEPDWQPDWQPDWSPDGSKIAFSRGPSDPLDLWIMDADGSNRRQIVEMPDRDEQPRWRPNPR